VPEDFQQLQSFLLNCKLLGRNFWVLYPPTEAGKRHGTEYKKLRHQKVIYLPFGNFDISGVLESC